MLSKVKFYFLSVYIRTEKLCDKRDIVGLIIITSIENLNELSEQLPQIGDRLPELLRLSLQQPAIPDYIYRYILDFHSDPMLVMKTDRIGSVLAKHVLRTTILLTRARRSHFFRLFKMKIPKYRPPTHPGEMLLKEFLEPMQIS